MLTCNLSIHRAWLAVVALAVASPEAAAQVMITPTAVLLGDDERIGNFLVKNSSDGAQEVTIDFRFGYPRSDSLGNLQMEYHDSAMAERYSMVAWIRAFPRRFVLPPGEEQLVRLMARPPTDLPDGVYWTRLITTSMPQSPPVDSVAEGTTVQIIFRLEQVTTVLYHRGAAHTGIEVGPITVRTEGAEAYLLVPLTRTGSAPFLGSVTVRIRDEKRAVVHETAIPLGVYFDLVQRVPLPAAALRSGSSYTVDVRVVAERSDLPATRLPRIHPVVSSLAYTAP